jgi:molecular chaperone Hsp33
VDEIIAERGSVEVTCDFCNARQQFDAVDAGQLFATGDTEPAQSGDPH